MRPHGTKKIVLCAPSTTEMQSFLLYQRWFMSVVPLTQQSTGCNLK
jgi:hypothetical protein